MKNNRIFSFNIVGTFVLLTLVSTLSLTSCTKDKGDDNNNKPIVKTFDISVHSPAANEVFNTVDSVPIHVHVMHELGLHEVVVSIKNLANDSTLWQSEQHVHDKMYSLETAWLGGLKDSTALQLKVLAGDHDGNSDSLKVNFFVKP